MKRYTIHFDPTGRWALVFDDASSQWHVEQPAARNGPARVTLEEFRKSKIGRLLAEQLADAVRLTQGHC